MGIKGKLRKKNQPRLFKVTLEIGTGSRSLRERLQMRYGESCLKDLDLAAVRAKDYFNGASFPVLGESYRLAVLPLIIVTEQGEEFDSLLDEFRLRKTELIQMTVEQQKDEGIDVTIEEAVAEAIQQMASDGAEKETSLSSMIHEQLKINYDYCEAPQSMDEMISGFHEWARDEHYRRCVDPGGFEYIGKVKQWQENKNVGGKESMPDFIPDDYPKWVF